MIRYSKRHGRKLKPNRAQRQRVTESFAAKTRLLATPPSLTTKPAAPLPEGAFKDRAGLSYSRESRGFNRSGLTIVRTAPRAVDVKRNERRARLAKTLNQHAA